MDPEALQAILDRLGDVDNPPTDSELSEARSEIAARMRGIDRSAPSDDDLRALVEGSEALRGIDALVGKREAETAERAAEAATLLEGLDLGEDSDVEPEPEAEPEGDAAGGDEGESAETETNAEAQTPEQIAADSAPRLPSIPHLAQRTPRRNRPVPTATRQTVEQQEVMIAAAGDMPGLSAGTSVPLRDWAYAVVDKWDAIRKSSMGDGVELVPLGRIRREFPPERFLDDNESGNSEKLAAMDATIRASGREVLRSSGGICGPVAADYTISTIGDASRPARDALVQYGASRGGVRYIRPHTLAQVHADGPASLWTEVTDAAPGGSTKSRAVYTCQSVQEDYVDAVVSRVKFGNFAARYFPEQVDQYMNTVDIEHSRLADGTLLGQMLTGSTLVTGSLNLLGAASDFFSHIDLAVAGYRWRHRMDGEAPLELWMPEWFEDELRADWARELPGNSGGQSERLAMADADIDRMFAVRNIRTVDYVDNPTGASPAQSWVAQGAGPLLPWPTKILFFLFHPGAWHFLDGGELNLGMVRDSTLNGTNDFELFSETFEKAIFRGHESIALLLDLCPFGGRAATVDATSLCTAGS